MEAPPAPPAVEPRVVLTGRLAVDADQVPFIGPVGSDGVLGNAPRGSNVVGGLADYNAVLYDASGNPVLVAANPGVVIPKRGTKTIAAAAPTATPTLVAAAASGRLCCTLTNAGTVTVFLGPTAAVTPATGTPLTPGAVLIDDATTDAWYGVTAGATGDVRVLTVA